MISKVAGLGAVWLAIGMLGSPARSAVIPYDEGLTFTAASQSFWGPGGSSASFASSAMFGSSGLGVSYSVGASTGTVAGDYAGRLTGVYVDRIVSGASWAGRFSFSGLAGHTISTLIGAHIDVTAHALGGDVCVLCYDRSLSGALATGPALDHLTSASDTLTFASPGVGVTIGIGSVKAGVDLKIEEDLEFTPLAVSAVLQATSDFGTVLRKNVLFDIDGQSERVSMTLFGRGDWTFDFVDLQLVNLFDNDFLLSVDPFVQYTVGVNCGDPGTNRDNGWFCLSDDKATFHLAGVSLYDVDGFRLNFTPSDLRSFTVHVTPEPGTLALILAAIGGGLCLRIRKA